MSSRLVNVRLDEDLLRKAKVLRGNGITMSELLRDAIDQKYAQLNKPRPRRDIEAIMNRIFEQYPDPPDMPPREYSVHDPKEARAAIIRHLEAKHRRNTEWYLKTIAAKAKRKGKSKSRSKRR